MRLPFSGLSAWSRSQLFQLGPALSHMSPVYYYIGRVPFPKGSTQLKLLEHRFGFDLPIWQQYLDYMKHT